MSEDYVKGFKDGFAAGLEEGKKLNEKSYTDGLIDGMKKTLPAPYNPIPPQWPTLGWPYITSDCVRGAVGSEPSQSYATGANGPAGSVNINAPQIKTQSFESRNGYYDESGNWYPDRSR